MLSSLWFGVCWTVFSGMETTSDRVSSMIRSECCTTGDVVDNGGCGGGGTGSGTGCTEMSILGRCD